MTIGQLYARREQLRRELDNALAGYDYTAGSTVEIARRLRELETAIVIRKQKTKGRAQ